MKFTIEVQINERSLNDLQELRENKYHRISKEILQELESDGFIDKDRSGEVYITTYGAKLLEAADIHNEKMGNIKSNEKFAKYLRTDSGRQLLEKYQLDEVGTWKIFGEDPNCDMGGPHHMPEIGFKHGTLAAVIEWAVQHPNFWTWGGGGDFKKIQIDTI